MDSYLGLSGNHVGKTFDKFLELIPDGTDVKTETKGSVYLGRGLVDADLVVDIIESTGDNKIAIQFCQKKDMSAAPITSPDFPIPAGTKGRFVYPIRNDPRGHTMSYIGVKPTVGGTLKMGMFLAKK